MPRTRLHSSDGWHFGGKLCLAVPQKRIVDHYNRSSAYIEARFIENGTTHTEGSLLSPGDYQAVGGSLPIRVKGLGVVGSVTVGGLTGELDHEYAVEGVRRFLAGK